MSTSKKGPSKARAKATPKAAGRSSVASNVEARRSSETWTRIGRSVNLCMFVLALIAIAGSIGYFLSRPELRMRIDATRTRAYSLSAQSVQLLDSLAEPWTIAIVLSEKETDRDARVQLQEIIDRYTAATDRINVIWIDPDTESLDEYEALLGRLQLIYAGEVEAYDRALDAGQDAFAGLQRLAQTQVGGLRDLVQQPGVPYDVARALEQRVNQLSILADRGHLIGETIDEARITTEAQPIPDYEIARSILAEALGQWSLQLAEMSSLLQSFGGLSNVPQAPRDRVRDLAPAFRAEAEELSLSADALRQLPPLELATIGRQLAGGQAAVVIGPGRAAVIPAGQLFPSTVSGSVRAIDRRFRGEQLISSTIRSLQVKQMPIVIFMHAGSGSLLQRRENGNDLVGAASLLRISRYEVLEWIVGDSERPEIEPDRPAVWIAIPPVSRTSSYELAPAEQRLIREIEALIIDGEPVMLNLNPSLFPGFGQSDPWAQLAAMLSIKADTARVLVESVTGAGDVRQVQPQQYLQELRANHPIARAAHGQQIAMVLPIALSPMNVERGIASMTPIIMIEPSATRWLETQWAGQARINHAEPSRDEHFTTPQTIFYAMQRPSPLGRGTQRAITVGSGQWIYSSVADLLVEVGPRVALVNPGNQELLLASVAWLAGMDELIAPSPISQQVSRLSDIDGKTWTLWFALAALITPAVCVALGSAVWLVRRR